MARVKTAGAGAVSYGKKETLLRYMKRHKCCLLYTSNLNQTRLCEFE